MTLATSKALAGLAGRLTDLEDRERYSAIVLYLQALPPEDEFRHLAELMGLLSLLGQRIPDALAEHLAELRRLTTTTGEYYGQMDARLFRLPAEIAEGVNVGRVAKDMSEAFRQQLAATGLETTATLLRSSSAEITKLSGQISTTLKPVSSTISTELAKLTAASTELQNYTNQLRAAQPGNAWLWQVTYVLVMFLLGGACGLLLERSQTADVLKSMTLQLERLQAPAVPATAIIPKKKLRGEKRKDNRG